MAPMIRLATRDDAAAVREIYAPYCLETPISFEIEAPSIDEMERRLVTTLETHPWLVHHDEAGVTGYAYAGPHNARAAYIWSVNVSVYVSGVRQRRGIGRALYATLFDLLRLQGFRAAFAGITLPNAASERLHRAMGFETVGVYRNVGYKCGRWHDVVWLQTPLGNFEPEPEPPLRLNQVRDTRPWIEALAAGTARLDQDHTTKDRLPSGG